MLASPHGAKTRGSLFASTQWTLVLEAGGHSNGRAALEELCRIYWPAIYASVRRRGYNVEDAQDMTQSFFQHILENDTLRRVSRERGRFRSFLLGALTLCLADEQARRNTLKRGAGVRFISAEELDAEELHHQESELGPDQSLDVRWARILLDRAIESVRSEFESNGKADIFAALSPFLTGGAVSYEEAARNAGMTLTAVKTLIHRLRRQFAAAVRREVMQTVSAPHEVDDELRQLRMVFARVTTGHPG
jgi:DNA-directed RNA polymerase specialized sigma24 family protein